MRTTWNCFRHSQSLLLPLRDSNANCRVKYSHVILMIRMVSMSCIFGLSSSSSSSMIIHTNVGYNTNNLNNIHSSRHLFFQKLSHCHCSLFPQTAGPKHDNAISSYIYILNENIGICDIKVGNGNWSRGKKNHSHFCLDCFAFPFKFRRLI